MTNPKDKWNSADSYENFMGRWSRITALEFVKWLDLPSSLTWLDVGCGTGSLSEAILENCNPARLMCVDPSEEFIAKTKEKLNGNCECFVNSADDLPFEQNSVDVIVSGLAFNFFTDPLSAAVEMKRVCRPGGYAAAYVWDYAGRMEFLRHFWDAAVQLDPQARELDEGIRFTICNPENLKKVFLSAGLSDIQMTNLDILTVFKNFEDYWNPFFSGQGPAPGYLASLSENLQGKLKEKIHDTLKSEPDGSIRMMARSFAIKGKSL